MNLASTQQLLPVDLRQTYRLLTDDQVLTALRNHPRSAAYRLQRLFHVPGRAVDWWALKAQLSRLATEGRVKPVVVRTGNRRPWIGWEVVP